MALILDGFSQINGLNFGLFYIEMYGDESTVSQAVHYNFLTKLLTHCATKCEHHTTFLACKQFYKPVGDMARYAASLAAADLQSALATAGQLFDSLSCGHRADRCRDTDSHKHGA